MKYCYIYDKFSFVFSRTEISQKLLHSFISLLVNFTLPVVRNIFSVKHHSVSGTYIYIYLFLSVVCITISIVYSHTVSFKPHSVICILGTCIVSCKHQAVSCKLSSSAVSFTHLFAQLKASLAASYMHLIGRLKTFLYQLYGFYLEQHSITQSLGT